MGGGGGRGFHPTCCKDTVESVARKLEAGRVAASIEGPGLSSSEAAASLSPSTLQYILPSIAALIDSAEDPLKCLRLMCAHFFL